MKQESIFIVDDHPLVIDAIRQAIESVGNFHILSAASAAEMNHFLASTQYTDWNIRLMFLDIRLPDANAIDLLPLLIARYGIPIIAMSGGSDEEVTLHACITKGAAGFISKSANLTTFSSALRIVLEGGLYFPAEYISGKKRATTNNVIASLNNRQRQILDLILKGKSNKQISADIFLAEGSVKNKVSELLSIFNLNSRSQIIVEATRLGYKPESKQE